MGRKNRQSDPDQMIDLLVKSAEGDFVIQIPANWKVTFGYVNPAIRDQGYRDGHCLRVYEGEKLRAVYSNVTGFRDLSIPTARKSTTEMGGTTWSRDDSGNYESSTKRQIEEVWQEEDTPAIERGRF